MKATEIRRQIPDTTRFFIARQFNSLTKTRFEARIKEAKALATKSEIKNTLDLGYKNREKREKCQVLDSRYLLKKRHSEDVGTKNYLVF